VRSTLFLLLLLTLASAPGCGLLFRWPKTTGVTIHVKPESATLKLDGQPITPGEYRVSDRDAHWIEAEAPGYVPAEAAIVRRLSWFYWGNILFGGIPGAFVDFQARTCYYLEPTDIEIELLPLAAPGKADAPH
jgi:hypothetical protein